MQQNVVDGCGLETDTGRLLLDHRQFLSFPRVRHRQVLADFGHPLAHEKRLSVMLDDTGAAPTPSL
jgi:hypothetical protein